MSNPNQPQGSSDKVTPTLQPQEIDQQEMRDIKTKYMQDTKIMDLFHAYDGFCRINDIESDADTLYQGYFADTADQEGKDPDIYALGKMSDNFYYGFVWSKAQELLEKYEQENNTNQCDAISAILEEIIQSKNIQIDNVAGLLGKFSSQESGMEKKSRKDCCLLCI